MTPLARFLAAHDAVASVRVERVEGSAPREAGAGMFVAADAAIGTIGGGQAEYMAVEEARALIARGQETGALDLPLGPEIGQCCGGRIRLSRTRMNEAARRAAIRAEAASLEARPQALIFGAGHVGRALAVALAPLPLETVLIDQRRAELDKAIPGVRRRLSALPEAEVDAARPGAAYVILTHDHALDFLIASEALARGDAAYVGMIGSATKRASFEGWRRRNEASPSPTPLICPIGAQGLGDKRPEVIALHAAAEIAGALLSPAATGETAATSR